MIPRTYPSQLNPATGRREMIAFFLTSITGLVRWVDYIPVKLSANSAPGREDHYNADGFIAIASIASNSGLVPYKDYVPVYVDNSATDSWSVNSVGFIPYGLSGAGGASLALYFAYQNATLDSRITFTRGSSGTYFNSAGILTTANNDAPRFDYDPSTLAPRGLLIEESRANLLLQSRDMTQAVWTKTDTTPNRNQVGLDGVANTACLMTEGSAGTAATLQLGAAVTAGSTITQSIVAKRGNTDWVRFRVSAGSDGCDAWFNLNTGAKGTVSALGVATSTSSTITNLGGGWYRLTVTCIPNGTFTQAQMQINSASADGSGTRVSGATYIVDCAQLEVGAFATSIIPTTTTSLTRAADSASMTGTNFSSWFNASAGTIAAEYVGVNNIQGATRRAVEIGDSTVNNRFVVGYSATNNTRFLVTASNTTQADITVIPISAGSTVKIAAAYVANDFQQASNGTLGVADTSGTVPTVDRMYIGGDVPNAATSCLNGWIRRITYYPRRLSNAELQAVTL